MSKRSLKKRRREMRAVEEHLRAERRSFLLSVSIMAVFTVFFLGLTVSLLIPPSLPAPEELPREECIFVRYELISTSSGKHRSHHYEITVEEYGTPLIIDNIAWTQADQSLLNALKPGDRLTASILRENDRLELLALFQNESPILSYENYLQKHRSNRTVGLVVCPLMTLLCIGGMIGSYVLYQKTTWRYSKK